MTSSFLLSNESGCLTLKILFAAPNVWELVLDSLSGQFDHLAYPTQSHRSPAISGRRSQLAKQISETVLTKQTHNRHRE